MRCCIDARKTFSIIEEKEQKLEIWPVQWPEFKIGNFKIASFGYKSRKSRNWNPIQSA